MIHIIIQEVPGGCVTLGKQPRCTVLEPDAQFYGSDYNRNEPQRAGSLQKCNFDNAVSNGPSEEVKWVMPEETHCQGNFKRAEVLKDTYNQRWKDIHKDKESKVVQSQATETSKKHLR